MGWQYACCSDRAHDDSDPEVGEDEVDGLPIATVY